MSYVDGLAATAAVFNVLLAVWNVYAVSRATAQLRKAIVLRQLLGCICVEAFKLRHTPIWKAWSGIMGELTVKIEARHIDAG